MPAGATTELAALLPKEPHAEPVTPVVQTDGDDAAEQLSSTPRWRWAQLLRRVFKIEVESCPKCNGTLKLVAMITETVALTRLLTHLGLPTSRRRCHDGGGVPPRTKAFLTFGPG